MPKYKSPTDWVDRIKELLQLRKRRQRPMLRHDDLGNRLSTLGRYELAEQTYFSLTAD